MRLHIDKINKNKIHSYSKINGYFISGKQTKNIKHQKSKKKTKQKKKTNKQTKTCHKFSVIYVTLQKIVQIFIVVSLTVDQTVPFK